MPEKSCTLKRSVDEDIRDVAEFVTAQVGAIPPLLIWADPDPMAMDAHGNYGRLMDFPLARDTSNWPSGVPIAEARLFWKDSALHVVARNGGGCRWVRIEEQAGDEVVRDEFKVAAVVDRTRFGLEEGATLPGLRAIEYRQEGRLVGWRLTIGTQE